MPGDWTADAGPAAATAVRAVLAHSRLSRRPGFRLRALRSTGLACYPEFRLVEALVTDAETNEPRIASLLIGADRAILLNGTATPIHHLNATGALDLSTPAQAKSYLRLFCAAVCGDGGAFRILDRLERALFTEPPTAAQRDDLTEQIRPLTLTAETDDHFAFSATVHYSHALFSIDFKVMRTGPVEMVDDTPIASDLPLYRDGFDGPFRSRHAPPDDGDAPK